MEKLCNVFLDASISRGGSLNMPIAVKRFCGADT